MSMLSQVRKGIIKKPHSLVVYGPDGVGKTTFCAGAPKPIFLGPEDGTNSLDVTRFPVPHKWADVLQCVDELTNEKHEYQSLIIDSLDWLEPVLHAKVCADNGNARSIELAAGGYGKGFTEAVMGWQDFLKRLTGLREKGINVLAIAHAEVIKFSDPQLQTEYDRYQLKLYKKSAALWREFVDAVLFANYETFSKREGQKTRAFSDGARVLHTERSAGFDAKNRFGLPSRVAMNWTEYVTACEAGVGPTADQLREHIAQLLSELTDPVLKEKATAFTEKAGDNVQTLNGIKDKLLIRLGEAN